MRRSSEPLDGWVLRLEGELPLPGDHPAMIDATIPGCVHIDLLAAGLIADPYVDRNELDVQWIGERAWTYHAVLDAPAAAPGERCDLVFAGLDGVATVSVNGAVAGTTANQHRTYRFDVSSSLRGDGNEVDVAFDSPVAEALTRRDRHGDLPNPYGTPYNFIRKMACNFGWDWGPQLTTSGLWRPVTLERWRCVRLAAVLPTARLATPDPRRGEDGSVDVAVELQWSDHPSTGGATITAIVLAPSGEPAGHGTVAVATGERYAAVTVPVRTVDRWWPAGRGAQPLYTLDVTVALDGAEVDRASRCVGFRDVRLDTDRLDDGNEFALRVNGERMWVRGVNWIPADCFPSRVTADTVRSRLADAIASNANLVRVWGGGLYESDEFYAQCDEAGLLVWQDFPFACAAYPEALLRDEVEAEATDNVARLMAHPSLVLWCGNNECLEGWWDWNWRDAVGEGTWGAGLYYDLLPSIVATLDPSRPYIDGTPTSLDAVVNPQDPASGTVHLWDVWNEYGYEHYRTHRPRFVAEFGFQAPATVATLAAGVTTRPLSVDDPLLAHHQRALDGEAKLARALERDFGVITDFDDWLFATQLNQARAVEVGVGHFRSLHARCSGVIWWQLNDCWPAISWAVVDHGGRRKPAWYAMRRAFADRLAVLDPTGEALALVLINDTRDRWTDDVAFHRVAPDGSITAADPISVSVPADGTLRLVVPSSMAAGRGDGGPVVATVGNNRAVQAAGAGRDSRLDRPRWEADVSLGPASVFVDVVALTFLRELCLFADRVDPNAQVDEQLITLLPGERHRFTVRTGTALDEATWKAAVAPPHGRTLVLRAPGDRVP